MLQALQNCITVAFVATVKFVATLHYKGEENIAKW